MSQKDSIQMCIGAEKKNRQNELFQYIWKRPKWPLQTPMGPPKHPKRSPNDVISLQGSCPKHPREFWKFKFWSVGFSPLSAARRPGLVPYRRKGIFWGQNFQIFETFRDDRYDIPHEKTQWWRRYIMSLSLSRAVQRYAENIEFLKKVEKATYSDRNNI